MSVYVTFALLMTITSVQDLDFAFKSGVPTKVVIDSTFKSEDGQFSSIGATLSDSTNHIEEIYASKELKKDGTYHYHCKRSNCSYGPGTEFIMAESCQGRAC